MDISTLNLVARLALVVIPLTKTVLAQDETITIASARFVVNPTIYILNGTTIAPGSAAVSIDAQFVSADSANDLFVDGVEVLTGYPAASLTSSVASASTTASKSSVFSTVEDNGSSRSANSESQSSGGVFGLMSASASGVASSPIVSSHWSNVSLSGLSTATNSSISSSALPLSSSAGLISFINTTTLASPVPISQITNTKPASSASSLAPDSILSSNVARSSSSVRPDPNSSINAASSASSKSQGLSVTSSSVSSAAHSSSLASIAGSDLDAAIYLSFLSSNMSIQSSYSTRSSGLARQGTSLSSKGTTSGLSHLATQVSSSILNPATTATAFVSSKTVSSMNVGGPSTASSIAGFITSGPTIAMPITTINPTGSVASAAGFSLGGLVLGIADQTVSNFITNSASSSSYVSNIEAVESKWDDFYKEIGGDDLPSYNTVCKGGGFMGLLKLAGCIASGLGMIKVGIESIDTNNPGPALTEIEEIIADVAEMAQEEESEEADDDDDNDRQHSQDELRPSKTPDISSTLRTLVSSTAATSSSLPSTISSSVVSAALIPCDSIIPQALPAVYSIDPAAAEIVLDFVGDILVSVFDGEMSGFTTSTLSDTSSVATLGTAVVSPQGTTKFTPSWTPTVIAEYSSSTRPSQIDSALTTLLTPSSSLPVYQCTMMYVPYPFLISKEWTIH
ncbi:hypothetical protein IMSHALPRED_002561 [Imshaugia aleurites]|uniref:Uncharacterized protein n=1 Tax=Imshaugia aleurites TaxID=172621 RepID=A0A8H3J5Z4_9LECA|nr:hypothetical protein IMSHALPRED_002561 [Imshaugia aleurites]